MLWQFSESCAIKCGVSTNSSSRHGPDLLLTPDDISKLLARVALHDRAAFDLVYEHTSAKLFGVALRLLKDRAEAEDALQEIYLKVWQRADHYAVSRASAISWLVAIARNHAIDRLRARNETEEIDDDVLSVPEQGPTPEASAIAGSERARVEDCLAQLENDRAEAIRGAYLDGYSYQELADRFSIPLNTMRTWLRRGLTKLKECLEG
jgi:RNA polymerase sigma-70 factor (ECF subfamily)